MLEGLREFMNGRALLLAVAAESEARAVAGALGRTELPGPWAIAALSPEVEMVITGVGKANAAGAVARVLDARRHGAVLSVGVAGSYGGPALRSVVVASGCAYADEGVLTPDGFADLCEMGFSPAGLPTMQFPVDGRLVEALRPVADSVGVIATVSTCSGTDGLAREAAARTGAMAEGMEGAAAAHAAYRLGVPAGELRVISNTCGDRAKQVWDVRGALGALTRVIGRVCG
jgi:futalosine hydrolase